MENFLELTCSISQLTLESPVVSKSKNTGTAASSDGNVVDTGNAEKYKLPLLRPNV